MLPYTGYIFSAPILQLGPGKNKAKSSGYAELRWAQTADIGVTPNKLLPDVFTASSMDIYYEKNHQTL